MKTEVRITGLGGQGAITIGHLIGRAAVIFEGKEAVVTEGYSPYVTGGWARADAIVSDAPIDYPYVSKLDALVAMYQEGLDLNAKLVKPGGLVLVEKKLVDASALRGVSNVVEVPAGEIAEKLGGKIMTNVVLLGALAAVSGVVSMGSLKKALADRFPKAAELNSKALQAGSDAVGAQREERAPG